jgi:hypothetical protein
MTFRHLNMQLRRLIRQSLSRLTNKYFILFKLRAYYLHTFSVHVKLSGTTPLTTLYIKAQTKFRVLYTNTILVCV